ncbi:HEPN domain-containing protein [Fluviicola taffensis]|uniref:Ferredoxin--nitrite reductase n=1 Tax=Fluviicola taffensis (strain DSM 16823 / NCIMB 13979 / RW262) TaxID=755732 RepID=F2IHT1_FLUTR|nr:HEPN domain-containing protein [Fluviicola taffensis]AEA45890.1 Ferredoxin--nitrite reductase [Fluviicola taffensis DSM 16823]
MESFRTEYELQVEAKKLRVEKDILELGDKIAAFKDGKIPDDKFRSLRLARGVYGQRQLGVQMIRIKLPYGKLSSNQLRRIAQVSDEYSTGRLHITTRQDIQIHHVSLDRTPQLWSDLEKDDVTLREACGNTVRNVTASDNAGINPNELFDVTPYAEQVFQYFLRKPFGQELGRKIKIAFSSDDQDDAFTFIHDFGFIPRIKLQGKLQVKGFKVLIGGGLGAQPFLAHVAYEFLSESEIIPFIEASIRIFDRYGERNSRNKARMKYLISKIGLETFLELVGKEKEAVQFDLNRDQVKPLTEFEYEEQTAVERDDLYTSDLVYNQWIRTNVFLQKQPGYLAVFVKVPLGDFYTDQARSLAYLLDSLNLPELRFTINQNIQIRGVKPEQLSPIYLQLEQLNLIGSGYGGLTDITACPGTDTCNLGISNSTNVALELESFIRTNYPKLIEETGIRIKISGCMNSCGQHGLAHIGFHGSSIKTKEGTLPALQVLLGGGQTGAGTGRIAEKVIKVPSKRILKVVQSILDDYLQFHENDEAFNAYYDKQGNTYFYNLLKPLTDLNQVELEEYLDWGQNERFATAIGVGECAGVIIDLVGTLFFDAEEKLFSAQEAWIENRYADSIYYGYAAAVHSAKAKLIEKGIRCNSQHGILTDFDTHLGADFGYSDSNLFSDFVLRINKEKASKVFAKAYLNEIEELITKLKVKNEY